MNRKPSGNKSHRPAKIGFFFLLVALSSINFACQSGEKPATAKNSINQAADSTPEKKIDYFQENLNSVQRAGFNFIYSFRRTDAGNFTGEDKKFLKANAPAETNQWLLTEDEKAVVAGSNYKFTDEHLKNLRARFTVEDYSVTNTEQNDGAVVNQNSSVNQNSAVIENVNRKSNVNK